MTPREFFPKMPDEVFNTWLAPFIKQIGWSFTEYDTDASKSRWRYLFGINTTVNEWRCCSWELVDIDITTINFSMSTKQMIIGIISGFTTKQPNAVTANLKGTNDRFRACTEFITANRCLPFPIVIRIINGEVKIIDGHHRIAALIHLKPSCSIKLQAWIAIFYDKS